MDLNSQEDALNPIFLSALVLHGHIVQPKQPPEMRLMRYPAVHGNEITFTYASDLWTANMQGGYARRLTSHPGTEVKPFYSPDGSMIAFTGQYDGNTDVYVMDADGGEPKRLTFEPDTDVVTGWTPQGKIAYVSTYGNFSSRQPRLWLVDPKGGIPMPTPILEASDVSFSPDGNKIAYNRQGSNRFNWRRYRGGSQGLISIYDLKENTYKELPHGRENSWNAMWIGDSIYYVSDKNQQTVNLYRYDTKNSRITQLTHYPDADVKWPSSDGKTIVFERDGYLYAYDIASGNASKLAPKIKGDLLATRPMLRRLAGDISSFSLSPSGVRIAVEARGDLFSVPAKNGDTRNFTNSPSSRERFPNWSPDGKTIAYVSDATGEYQIYTMPQLGGKPTQLTELKDTTVTDINWTPDNKKIYFTTVANDLMLLDLASKKVSRIKHSDYGISSVDVSPDSKWLAYVESGKNLFGALYFYEIATGKVTKVTEGYYRDDSVSFDLSGKYLWLVSSRTYTPEPGSFEFNLSTGEAQRIYVVTLSKDEKNPFSLESDEEPAGAEAPAPPKAGKPPKPDLPPPAPPTGPPPGPPAPPASPMVKVDLDGLGDRLIPLALPAGSYPAIIGANEGVFYASPAGLAKYDLRSKQSMPLMPGIPGGISFNQSRTKIAYSAGGVFGVVDVHPGIQPGEGRVDLSSLETVVDPRAEWKQIFWEAWRFERDNFYDKDFLGLNWNEIGQRYAKYLPYVAHRSDLNYVLGLMIGEFGTSHAYVGGGDMGAPVPTIPIGQLGADYETAGGKVRFKKIYRGLNFEESRRGPLGEPGVNIKDGDYLLEINGKAVDEKNSPDSLLVDKAGKRVQLTVNSSPTLVGAHKVEVRPIGGEGELRYIEWVEANRRAVAKMSNGRIGYLHVPDTSMPGMVEFLKGYYSQSDKEALIVDERWNGGGQIPTFFIEKLARTYKTGLRARNEGDISFPVQTVEGPKAMLINGYAGSGGDLFPWLFRQSKLGPLIGERTWGGLVGIGGGAPLLDGGFLTAPGFGLYDMETGTWIAENTGVEPDIEVDARPDLVAQGKDPQLEKAVEYLMGELKKGPRKTKRPNFPRVIKP